MISTHLANLPRDMILKIVMDILVVIHGGYQLADLFDCVVEVQESFDDNLISLILLTITALFFEPVDENGRLAHELEVRRRVPLRRIGVRDYRLVLSGCEHENANTEARVQRVMFDFDSDPPANK